MLGNKQGAGDYSQQLSNIDAGRDIIIQNGMNFNEIKEMFQMLIKLNFPTLIEEASKKSLENINIFYIQLEQKMKEEIQEISKEQLASVDTQYVMKGVIENVARRGEQLNLEMITSLLIEKFKNETEEEKNILLNESLEIMVKLTKEEIEFLALMVLYYKCTLEVVDNNQLNFAINKYNDFINCEVLNIKTTGLEWKNAIRVEFELKLGEGLSQKRLYIKEKMALVCKMCNIDTLNNRVLDRIAELEKSKKLYNIKLTDIGLMIGATYLKTEIKYFDVMGVF